MGRISLLLLMTYCLASSPALSSTREVSVIRGETTWLGTLLGTRIQSRQLAREVFRPEQKIEISAPPDHVITISDKIAIGNWAEYSFTLKDAEVGSAKLRVAGNHTQHFIDLTVREFMVELIRDGEKHLLTRTQLRDDKRLREIFKPGSRVQVNFQDGEPGSVWLGDQLFQGTSFTVEVPAEFGGKPGISFDNAPQGDGPNGSFLEWEKQRMIPLNKAETERLLEALENVQGSDCYDYKESLRESLRSGRPAWAIVEGTVLHPGNCSRTTEKLLPTILDASAETRKGKTDFVPKPALTPAIKEKMEKENQLRSRRRKGNVRPGD